MPKRKIMFAFLRKKTKYLLSITILILFSSIAKPGFGFPKPQKPYSQPSASSISKYNIGQSRLLLNQYKKQISLQKEQFEMCIGLVLGDTHLQTQNNGKSYRLKFEVGEKNLDYLKHIQEKLDPFILSQPNEIIRVNKYGHEVKTFQLQTISHESFNRLANGFQIQKGKKSIDSDFLSQELTTRSIAYWFMDDGGKLDYTKNEGKGIVFHTQNFEQEEVQKLCDILKTQFGYETWPKKNKDRFIVAISGKSYENLTKDIYPYIIPSMQHKWPRPRKS